MEQQALIFKDITLQDRTLINTYLQQEEFMISDISFGNLFIWRLARKIAFCILHDCLIIETTYINEAPFCFFPIGSGDKKKALISLHNHYKQKGQNLIFHSIEKQNHFLHTFKSSLRLFSPIDSKLKPLYSSKNLLR